MKVKSKESGLECEAFEAGASDKGQQEIMKRLIAMAPVVTSVRVFCKVRPCTGKGKEHSLRVGMFDGDHVDIEKGMFLVTYEDRLAMILTAQQFEALYEREIPMSKKERWFSRGYSDAIDAVLDEIGADISPMLRQQISSLKGE